MMSFNPTITASIPDGFRLTRIQFLFSLNGASVDAQYDTKKMTNVGIRITKPSPKGGLITMSGREAITPIRMSEVGWLCPEMVILPCIRNGIPTHSLRTSRIIIG